MLKRAKVLKKVFGHKSGEKQVARRGELGCYRIFLARLK